MDTINEEFFYVEIETPPPPEFRLYYDEQGSVVCYTCENLEGNYIVIDKDVYLECRPDLKIVDGKIATKSTNVVTKLIKSNKGVRTASEDINIVVDEDYKGKTNNWELKIYEL